MPTTKMTEAQRQGGAEGIKQSADFFTDYAALLLSSGATTLRTEKNICRMAEFQGLNLSFTIMPKHVELMVTNGQHTETRIKEWRRGINFFAITALSRLSWRVVEHNAGIQEAQRELEKIKLQKRLPVWVVTIMAALANASFCRLFEGDYHAMAFVFIATACGFYTKHKLTAAYGVDIRIATVMAACFSAVISCGPYIYGLGSTPDTALATSVLYLVPGIPFINAFSDFIGGHYICALSWLMSALETTVCLGTGLVLGSHLLNI